MRDENQPDRQRTHAVELDQIGAGIPVETVGDNALCQGVNGVSIVCLELQADKPVYTRSSRQRRNRGLQEAFLLRFADVSRGWSCPKRTDYSLCSEAGGAAPNV